MDRWTLMLDIELDEEALALKERLEREGCRVKIGKDLPLMEESYLLLTDAPHCMDRAFQMNIPVIYYERPGSPPMYRTDMTVLGLSELDRDFFQRIYERHYGLPVIIAETQRLLIRESIMKDSEGLWMLMQDEEARRNIPALDGGREDELEKLSAYIRSRYTYYGYGLYTVIWKETGEIAGRIGYEEREYQGEIYTELGYLVGREYRNRGIAKEACLALAKDLERLTGYERAAIFCEKDNQPSRRVAETVCRAWPRRFRLIIL